MPFQHRLRAVFRSAGGLADGASGGDPFVGLNIFGPLSIEEKP